MAQKSFTLFNQHLLEVLPGILGDLQGERFHYLKIAQHAAVYHFAGSKEKLIAHRFQKPFFWQSSIYQLKSIRAKSMIQPELKALVLIDSGRSTPNADGKPESVYFQKIKSHCSTEISHLIALNGSAKIDHDYQLKDQRLLAEKALHKDEKALLKDINKVLQKLKENPLVSANFWEYLASAFHRFFEEFHLYFQLLHQQGVKKIVATNHYHQEGLIAACRLNGIPFYELQHGLMSKCDLYYVYPEILLPKIDLKNAFFADTLFLYGPFWKTMLEGGYEQQNSTLKIAGDYVYKAKKDRGSADEKKKIIFIGAQKNMHADYVVYIRQLLKVVEKSYPDWTVQVKLHPLEKHSDQYYAIEHPQLDLRWNESDLQTLLNEAMIQVSVYSTTLYDALGADVVNFSLQNFTESSDYAQEMVDMKVAFPLGFDEDPIAAAQNYRVEDLISRSSVYAPFEPQIFIDALDHE